MQAAVKDGKFVLAKVPGKSNPADWLTKPGSASSRAPDMKVWGMEIVKREDEGEEDEKGEEGQPRRRWADIVDDEEDEDGGAPWWTGTST